MKISLYNERTMFECLEATFDFLRANRRVWFRSALLLFLPICVVVSLMMFFSIEKDSMGKDVFFWFENFSQIDNYSMFIFLAWYVAVCAVMVQIHSLLSANEERAEGVEGMSLKELRPWFIRTAIRSWYLPLFFVLLVVLYATEPILGFLMTVVMVPLALLPALHLIERLDFMNAISKAILRGFPIWFKIFVNIVLVSLLGLYVFLMLFLPTGFFSWMLETVSTSQLHELERLFVIALGFAFTVLASFGLCVVFSMVVLVCAYLYGSMSEEIDASSLEGEVADFENER